MKIRIETVEGLSEDEVFIRCGRVDDTIRKLRQYIIDECKSKSEIIFYKDNQEFYFPINNVLFFETENEYIYAHTASDAYRIKHRLYELEALLPMQFVRAAKSAIVNTLQIYSITRNITASSLIRFIDSHKQVYVSRFYYKELRQRLNERGKYNEKQ